MKLLEFQKKIKLHNMKIFTPIEFQRVMKLKKKSAQELLSRYAKKNIVVKLRNGSYSTESNPASVYLISNKIYQPSYLSFETAMSHHGIIPETVYEVIAATTKTTREFNIQGKVFVYHKIKRPAYTGYTPIKIDGDTILMAEPEKALADYLYFVHIGKKPFNERLNTDKINKKDVLKYTPLYNRKKFMEFVKNAI